MKRLLILLVTFISLSASAQDSMAVVNPMALKFGYLSYEQALKSMPDYTLAQQTLSDLHEQYAAEQKRVEQDFNMKYEEFLEGQRDFPQTILRKRQTELRELLERNVAFKAESRRQLAIAEKETLAPLREKLTELLNRIGLERGYAFILDTDAAAVPFIHPAMGIDISAEVMELLQTVE